MGRPYSIDLIDRNAYKTRLGTVKPHHVHWAQENGSAVCVDGELHFSPADKQIYLQTASNHGDTLKLSISDEKKTLLGNFQVSFFDPVSCKAIFISVGAIEVTAC